MGDLDVLKTWLRAFHKVDEDGDGFISRKEFGAIMLTPADDDTSKLRPRAGTNESTRTLANLGAASTPKSVDQLFSFFDTDGSGSISYREFVQAVALLSGKCSAATRAKLAFLVYDVDGQGSVSRNMLREAVDNAFAEGPQPARKSVSSSGPDK